MPGTIPAGPVVAPSASDAPRPAARGREAALMRAAQALEATFLAEMLKDAGLGAVPGAFGGGAGEEQFASLLRTAQAEALVRAGGIGLAERLFAALSRDPPAGASAERDLPGGGDGPG